MQPSVRPNGIYFINVTKTFGIFLVAMSHLPVPHNLYAFINSFIMPLFFILTGYLTTFDDMPLKEMWLKKIKRLLLPYYIFATITFAFWFFLGKNYGDDAASEHNTLQYILGLVFAIPSKAFMGFNLPIWFLPALFCSEILLYLGTKFFKKYLPLFVFLCLGIGVVLKEYNVCRLPFGIDVALFAMFFIQIGQWLKNGQVLEKYIANLSFGIKAGFCLLFLGITCYISHLNDAQVAVSLVDRVFNNYFLYIVGALSGSLFLLYGGSCFPKIHLFSFFGRNTIIILGFHIMTLGIVKGIQVFLLRIPLETTEGILGVYFLYVITVFLLLSPVIYLVNKYMPFLLGRHKGIW
jgi:fucose 4-O-acetylase-like acetyltransferase